jgi:hypothetical protein
VLLAIVHFGPASVCFVIYVLSDFLGLKAKGLSQEYVNQKHCAGNAVKPN